MYCRSPSWLPSSSCTIVKSRRLPPSAVADPRMLCRNEASDVPKILVTYVTFVGALLWPFNPLPVHHHLLDQGSSLRSSSCKETSSAPSISITAPSLSAAKQ